MGNLKIILSALAAFLLAEVLLSPAFRGLSSEKATGLGMVVSGFYATQLSPSFWIAAALLFLLFFGASRIRYLPLRIVLFWTPTVLISSLGLTLAGGLTYLFIRFRPR